MPEPERFLRTCLHMRDEDLRKARTGKVVTKILERADDREVASVGMAVAQVPADFFVQAFRDIETFKQGPEVLQIHKVSDPEQGKDFHMLALEQDDVKALMHCRVGDCQVKIPAQMIERFYREVDWDTPDHRSVAVELFRQFLSDYVARYWKKGNSAMMVYADKKQPLRTADEFTGLLEGFPFLKEIAPELGESLREFPNGQRPEIRNFLYWSRERFGLKTVLSLTHVIDYETTIASRKWHFLVSKQIYASHYFQASMGLTILIDADPENSRPSCWILYLNRSRVDGLGGWLGPLKRAIVSSRLRSGLGKKINLIRAKLESRYQDEIRQATAQSSVFGERFLREFLKASPDHIYVPHSPIEVCSAPH